MSASAITTVVSECLHGMVTDWCALCHPSVNVGQSITAMERQNKRTSPSVLAQQLADRLSSSQQRTFLIRLLTYEFDSARRNRVRNVERQATRLPQEILAITPWIARPSSSAYKTWAKSPNRHEQRAAHDPNYAEYLEHCKRRNVEPGSDYTTWNVNKALENVVNAVRQEILLELTEELLSAEFVVNGKTVTWGSASVEEHEHRAKSLLIQAAGTVDTAKRHQAAIEMIENVSASNLNEVKRVMIQ
jgi:hypothetical protein